MLFRSPHRLILCPARAVTWAGHIQRIGGAVRTKEWGELQVRGRAGSLCAGRSLGHTCTSVRILGARVCPVGHSLVPHHRRSDERRGGNERTRRLMLWGHSNKKKK